MKKLGCAKCGGTKKMKLGGSAVAKAPVNIFGIPQQNLGTSGQSGNMKKGGTTKVHPLVAFQKFNDDRNKKLAKIKENLSNLYKGKKKSPEHIEAVRIARLQSPKSRGYVAWNKGLPSPMKGKSLGPKDQLQCPHCNKAGGSNAMKRYHFDNCKLKIR